MQIIHIYKRLFNERNLVTLYTSDVLLDNKILLTDGRIPSNTEEYISDVDISSINQIGEIKPISRDYNIVLKSIVDLEKNVNINGAYFIGTSNKNTVENIVDDITRLYPSATFFKDTTLVYNEKTFLNLALASILSMGMYGMNNMAMVSSIISLVIMILTSIIYFNIKNRKNIYICKLFGYSNNKISIENSLKIIVELLKFSVIVIVTILVGSFFSLTSIIELKYLLIVTFLVSVIAILICF